MIVTYWVGERLLRHERGLHQTLEYRPYQAHVPDAIAQIYSKTPPQTWEVAIEVERSYKGPADLDDILAVLAANTSISGISAHHSIYTGRTPYQGTAGT